MFNTKEANNREKIDRKLNANIRILNFKSSIMMTETILSEIICLKCFHYKKQRFLNEPKYGPTTRRIFI